MKPKIILILLSVFLFSFPGKSQSDKIPHAIILELVDTEIQFQTEKGTGLIRSSSNKDVQNVLTKHNTSNFFKCVQNAKKERFRNLYQVEFSGNIDTFIKEIEATGKFRVKKIIQGATLNTCTHPMAYNDTWFVNNWINSYAVDMIDAGCAWNLTTGNSSVVVGIADTEFITHEDLSNQIVQVQGPVTAQHRHGLNVAGCCSPETNNGIGIAGIGYNTKIAGYRASHVINPTSGILTIFPYAAIIAAWNDDRPVINASVSDTELSVAEAQDIVNDGITLVLAGGNRPNASDHSAIADIPGVIVVGGVDQNNEHGPTGLAHNQWIDLCAPAINVSTCEDPNQGTLYASFGGTSAAAPIVSGTIGLMLARNSALRPDQIEEILESTCEPIDDANLFPGLLGAGRLNAYYAVVHAVPRELSGLLGGTYSKYFINVNGGDIFGSFLNLYGAEVTINGPFEVELGEELTISRPSSFGVNY